MALGRLLDELKAHHARVMSGMQEIDHLTSQASPDNGRLALARVRLSKVSLSRSNFLTETIYPALIAVNDGKLHQALADLSTDYLEKRQHSSAHVTRWTIKAIEEDWEGYTADSKRIRAMMKERIDREAAVLYPHLS